MQADRETAEDRARRCFPLHNSWRPLCSLPSGGNATTEQESGHHQHTSIIGSSWVVPNRTQGGGTKSRLFPSRYSPTAGLPFGGDAKPLSCVPSTHTGNNWTRKGAGLPMDPGPRAAQLPAPLPRGGNELQGNAAERCQNNFY